MNSIKTLRFFLAIPIPETIQSELRRLQLESQPLLPPQKPAHWTKPFARSAPPHRRCACARRALAFFPTNHRRAFFGLGLKAWMDG